MDDGNPQELTNPAQAQAQVDPAQVDPATVVGIQAYVDSVMHKLTDAMKKRGVDIVIPETTKRLRQVVEENLGTASPGVKGQYATHRETTEILYKISHALDNTKFAEEGKGDELKALVEEGEPPRSPPPLLPPPRRPPAPPLPSPREGDSG